MLVERIIPDPVLLSSSTFPFRSDQGSRLPGSQSHYVSSFQVPCFSSGVVSWSRVDSTLAIPCDFIAWGF